MSLTRWIPDALLELGPWDLAWWQWIAIALLVVVAMLVGRIAVGLFGWVLRRLVSRTQTTLDDDLITRLAGPFRLLGTIATYRLAMPIMELPASRAQTLTEVLLALLAIGIVWGVLRTIDVIITHAAGASWAASRPSSRALMMLVGKILKVVVVIIAGVSALGALGLPIASVLAGLGIGGIAIAFGAQKTVENLFGAFAIGVDQPLREGDFVKVEADVLGTVEEVGLRSTRIRTPDRTVVTLPNGRLSDMRIETFALRDRCRLVMSIGLVYGTTAAQLRSILNQFEETLKTHPKIWPQEIVVKLSAFGASSLDVDVACHFVTSDWNEFRGIRQDILLAFMTIVENAGSSFAFPTRTLHVASLPAKAA